MTLLFPFDEIFLTSISIQYVYDFSFSSHRVVHDHRDKDAASFLFILKFEEKNVLFFFMFELAMDGLPTTSISPAATDVANDGASADTSQIYLPLTFGVTFSMTK